MNSLAEQLKSGFGSKLDSDSTYESRTEASKHSLNLKIEKRKGKVVTVIGEFDIKDKELKALSKKVKKSLGSGGTINGGFLEFQGDVKDKAKVLIEKEGFRFKS